MGRTPNVSLLPGETCPEHCKCREKCYANKATRRPSVFRKWAANTALWKSDPREFERQIMVYCEKRRPEFFRWQVAGDIPDVNYLRMMIRVACRFPDTKFLAFTKRYDHFASDKSVITREDWAIPDNLTVVLSGWPDYRRDQWAFAAGVYPIAWVNLEEGGETFLGSFKCPGKCESCRHCWGMVAGECVEFEEH